MKVWIVESNDRADRKLFTKEGDARRYIWETYHTPDEFELSEVEVIE